MFNSNEHTEDYHIRKPNNEKYLLETEDKNFLMREKILVAFETNDKIVKYSSDLGFNDVNYLFAYGGENIQFTLHQNCIFVREYNTSTQKNEYH